MHPVVDTTEIKCTYQPNNDTVLIVQDGTQGIKVLEVPAADLQRALDEKPYQRPEGSKPPPYYPPGVRSGITPGARRVPVMPNIVKPSIFARVFGKV